MQVSVCVDMCMHVCVSVFDAHMRRSMLAGTWGSGGIFSAKYFMAPLYGGGA